MTSLLQKIESKTAHVVVIGIGYVGLPLVAEFARAGFRTTGLDKDPEKVRLLNAGESYIADVPTSDLAPHVKSRLLDASTDRGRAPRGGRGNRMRADAVEQDEGPGHAVHRPPQRKTSRAINDDGMVVILESTTYPGTTSEVLVPRLTQKGAVLGRTVFIAFSPERVDPGNEVFKTKNTPKVLGGASPECLQVASALYSHILDKIVPVSSTETAEMVKLLENTFPRGEYRLGE